VAGEKDASEEEDGDALEDAGGSEDGVALGAVAEEIHT